MQELAQQAQFAVANKDYSGAVKLFHKIANDKNNVRKGFAFLSKSLCLWELNEFDECEKSCLQVLENDLINSKNEFVQGCYNTHAAAYSILARIYKKRKDSKKEQECHKKMTELIQKHSDDIEKAEQIKELGNKVLKSGMKEQALELYQQASQLDSTNPAIFSNLSHVYLLQGNLEKAQEMAERCVLLDQNWPKGWFRKGNVALKKNQFLEAAAAFKRGIELEPENDEFKRLFSEATAKAEKKPVSKGGIDKNLVGILMQIKQNSWDFKAWLKDHTQAKFWPIGDETRVNEWWSKLDITSGDFNRLVKRISEFYPLNLKTKTFQDFCLLEDPLISALLFQQILNENGTDQWSVVWTLQAKNNKEQLLIHKWISQNGHGCYPVLVNGEENIVFDFLGSWERINNPKLKYSSHEFVQECMLGTGLIYTCDDQKLFLEFLESFYKSKRDFTPTETLPKIVKTTSLRPYYFLGALLAIIATVLLTFLDH